MPISFKFSTVCLIHTVKDFSIVNEAEVGVFLEFSCFFYDPMNVGNLISNYSAFSKSRLNIWKFSVHILPKPGVPGGSDGKESACNAGGLGSNPG